jgi:Asp-tRNA(Asn)/Glu-tRNA(Gln) amidotransferase A subunit family amidase
MLAELATAVRNKQISPTELVEESLRRIERDNPSLNAVICLDADRALESAKRADNITGPLAGIPVLIKDLTRAEGMPTKFGCHLYENAGPDTVDDIVTARYRAAGAIVVGKTNTPAYGHQALTTNLLNGPTRNPWNLDQSPGGSSGGSAAAIAASLAPLASTTDGGGSVRLPASFCGLVGYKPTNGAIGRAPSPRWMWYSTPGATGRSVADVILEATVLFGPVRGDLLSFPTHALDMTPRVPKRVVAIRGLRGSVEPIVGEHFDSFVHTIENDLRIPVTTVDSYTQEDVVMAWVRSAAVELAESLAYVRDRWDEFEPSLLSQLHLGESLTAADYVRDQRIRFRVLADLENLIGDDGVLICPTINVESYPALGPVSINVTGSRIPGSGFNTMDFNATGNPCLSMPMGLDSHGVPTGFQIVAPRFSDGLALGLAQVLEENRPWSAMPLQFAAWPKL